MKIPFVIGKTNRSLDKAADLIETKGWGQGRFWHYANNDSWGPKCNFCSAGALMEVSGDYAPLHKFENFLGEPTIAWNDSPDRTAEEVIQTFRQAARTIF